jgi:hypothetical protein
VLAAGFILGYVIPGVLGVFDKSEYDVRG